MSTAKRSRRRQSDPRAASPSPASKRIKTLKSPHVPKTKGLDFLVDENKRDGRKLEARPTNGVPVSKATRVDESRAVVAPDVRDVDAQVGASQQTAIELSSGAEESSSEEEESDDEDHVEGQNGLNGVSAPVNGHVSEVEENAEDEEQIDAEVEDVDMADGDVQQEDVQLEEPSFGDLLQARHPEPIDVHASMTDLNPERHALVPTAGEYALSAPLGATLKTVLTQALKTNDKELLERCFQTTDLNDIRATIERLQSQHVATLLQKLAERIHKRPGRTGTLVTWIHWSLVAHGAYLASQPEVMKQLRSLAQVLRERASGLQPLLRLKGKLDMLSAQLELRQRMQAASRAANVDEDEEADGVIYVEGQDDDWSEDEDDAAVEEAPAARRLEQPISKAKGQTATPRSDMDDSSDNSESEDDMPNGVIQEGNDESSEDEAEGGGVFDLEAEETDDDSAEEESEDDESAGEGEEDGSESSDPESEPAVRPAKPSTLNRRR